MSADLGGLPPLQIIVAEYETLRAGILLGARRAMEAGVEVEIVDGEGAVHCCSTVFPGPRDTVGSMADFVRRRRGKGGSVEP